MSGDQPTKDVPSTEDEAPPGVSTTKSFLSAYTVLAIVTVAVWVLAFVVPAGQYQRDENGSPISGSYQQIPSPESFGDRVSDLFLAPVNGMYGIENSDGVVGPDNTGDLFGSVSIFFFVLAIGIFVTMMLATGALDRGIGRLAHRLSSRGWLLIVAIMGLFSLLGSIEGFAEETLGFYGLIIPLMLALGYDRMVAVGTIILGAGVGCLTSTLNPFAIGVASGAAGVPISDGIGLRLVMWVVLTTIVVLYVLRYARKVKADPAASRVGFLPGDLDNADAPIPPPLTKRHIAVLLWVAFTFAVMIFGIIPWSQIIGGVDAEPYAWELGWGFGELTAWFIVSSIVVGLIGGLGEKRLSELISQGAGDFISAGLVIVLARGVAVIMNNTQITDTVLHAMEGAVSSAGSALFAILIFIVNLPLAFLIPSTSGHATLAMPIMAPLADFAGVSRSLVITAWAAASGWMNLWVPTTAVVMGGLSLAKVGYDKYLKFVIPLLGILFVSVCLFLGGAALLGVG